MIVLVEMHGCALFPVETHQISTTHPEAVRAKHPNRDPQFKVTFASVQHASLHLVWFSGCALQNYSYFPLELACYNQVSIFLFCETAGAL